MFFLSQLNVAGFKAKSALSVVIFKKALALKQPRGESVHRGFFSSPFLTGNKLLFF